MASTHRKPALCRVLSYSLPGLPRPTMSLISSTNLASCHASLSGAERPLPTTAPLRISKRPPGSPAGVCHRNRLLLLRFLHVLLVVLHARLAATPSTGRAPLLLHRLLRNRRHIGSRRRRGERELRRFLVR